MAELIADCADIPAGLRYPARTIPQPRSAEGWSVTEACLAQVRQLDEYV
jgi:hypothetical protein